jgi:hypothetical protein
VVQKQGETNPVPEGGRAAERLRMFEQARRPAGEAPNEGKLPENPGAQQKENGDGGAERGPGG